MDVVRKHAALCCLLCALAGWMVRDASIRVERDRPVLKIIAKAAKAALWVFLIADSPPDQPPVYAHDSKDGYQTIDHGKAL